FLVVLRWKISSSSTSNMLPLLFSESDIGHASFPEMEIKYFVNFVTESHFFIASLLGNISSYGSRMRRQNSRPFSVTRYFIIFLLPHGSSLLFIMPFASMSSRMSLCLTRLRPQ